VNKQDIDPAKVRIRPIKEQDVAAVAVIDSMYFGALRPEYYREQLGSAINGAGINISLVADARTNMLQVDCKG
jgi:hypothetical protein